MTDRDLLVFLLVFFGHQPPLPGLLPLGGYEWAIGYEVEANIMRHHEEAVQAWREGRLPTVDPPASPTFFFDGSGL